MKSRPEQDAGIPTIYVHDKQGKWRSDLAAVRLFRPIHYRGPNCRLPKKRDEETLGSEAANVHLGTELRGTKILKDLQSRKSSWLKLAAKDMAQASEQDWQGYREA